MEDACLQSAIGCLDWYQLTFPSRGCQSAFRVDACGVSIGLSDVNRAFPWIQCATRHEVLRDRRSRRGRRSGKLDSVSGG